jgi:hypothetical protein
MTHYKAMMESPYVGAWDLNGKDVTVTIAKVERGTVKSKEKPKGDKKPLIYFAGKAKPLVANVTNCKTIAGMYGTQVEEWIGKRITLFATTTESGGQTVDCIRVRPRVPNANVRDEAPTPPDSVGSDPSTDDSLLGHPGDDE